MPSLRFDTLIGWKYGDQVFPTSHLTNDELKWKLHYKCFDDFTVPGIAELVVPQFCCKAADPGNRPAVNGLAMISGICRLFKKVSDSLQSPARSGAGCIVHFR